MKCFYHSGDFDGICSGAIVKHKYPDCEMFGIDYGDEFPWDVIVPGETVFICDFTIQPFEGMDKLNKMVNLIWIDHHKRTIEVCAKYGIPGLRRVGTAGCELTWEQLYPNVRSPIAVYLLGRYDVWNHTDIDVIPFQYAMRSLHPNKLKPGSATWKLLLEGQVPLTAYLEDGRTIWRYVRNQDAEMMDYLAFKTEFEGLKAIAVNLPKVSSYTFKSVWDPEKYDIMIAFSYAPDGHWRVSLRTDKPEIDCSEVATKYGGGGHREAAGFQIKDISIIL